ncbi:metal ABC transporter permease [Clostridium sp. DL1XJH146]
MLEGILKYVFLRNAAMSIILISILCSIIGTIVVEKKMVMMSGGIAHTSFGGIGLGYLLGFEPILGALIFAIFSSLGISKINKEFKTDKDTLIGMFWAFGMSLGIIFIYLAPGYPPDMTSYLFGDILSVTTIDLFLLALLDLLIVFLATAFFEYLRAYLFDAEFMSTMGINVEKIEYIVYILIACAIVLLIRGVGIILVIAMLTIPVAIAKQLTKNLKRIIVYSSVIGIVFGFLGLTVSYYYNVASGASIIISLVLGYVAIVAVKKYILKYFQVGQKQKEFTTSKY